MRLHVVKLKSVILLLVLYLYRLFFVSFLIFFFLLLEFFNESNLSHLLARNFILFIIISVIILGCIVYVFSITVCFHMNCPTYIKCKTLIVGCAALPISQPLFYCHTFNLFML